MTSPRGPLGRLTPSRVSGSTVVRWDLTASTCHLFEELSWWTGERRSDIATQLLSDAAARWSEEGSPTPDIVARHDRRAPLRLGLPVELVNSLEHAAMQRGWTVELLVEHLASDYLAVWLGVLVRARVAPLGDLSGRVWGSVHAGAPRVRPSVGVA